MAPAISRDRMVLSEDRTFCAEIERLSGQNVRACYQCGECTAGCPVAYAADLMPNQVTRLVQLGQEEDVLRSSMIWLCVGCEICTTRCPRDVELSKVMDALRETAIQRGVAVGEPDIKTFHETFLRSLGRGGRVHEVSMLAEYKIRSGHLLSDLSLGSRLFFKGKLALMPDTIKGRGEVKKIMDLAKRR